MNDHEERGPSQVSPPATEAPSTAPPPSTTTPLQQALLQRKIDRRLQRRAAARKAAASADPHAVAQEGVSGSAQPLPHLDAIQRSFGRHDVGHVQAHVGGAAASAADQLGAVAYATGDATAFREPPDLHTAAHEAAHVVQQRAGVHLAGGVGMEGDPYERHADAVADAVVAGRSAEHLLDEGAGGGTAAGRALQRKEMPEDAGILANQANLKNTDIEIPSLEGALLSGRLAALKKGLLSQASFDAGLVLSQRMTQFQPAVKANRPVDAGVQSGAAAAARQLYSALQRETAADKNFKIAAGDGEGAALTSENPYTGESKVTTAFFVWTQTNHFDGWAKRLPDFIQAGNWRDAFEAYKRLMEGLDLWVADQLRSKGKGTPEEAQGNAQTHFRQLRDGLENIADKHATRLPALFHPDAATVKKDKEAGRPAIESVPLNVYLWKDAADGKYHLYDLTTPGRPHEQPIGGEPTAAAMNTFFEEVARYPLGEVRFQLPNGTSGVAPTTGKTKWYEWLGYAGLAVAGVGLAFLTGGASVPATVCFAAGALAGGVSAAGHLADTASLGTATAASVTLDVAQVVSSVASFGALGITVKAGGAAAALAGSRVFVPLTLTAAGADVVQLAAFSNVAYHELETVRKSGGSDEDVKRAGAILLTQLAVMGGLTVLSVRGARDVTALRGRQLELVTGDKGLTLQIEGECAVPKGGDGATTPKLPTDPAAGHAPTAATDKVDFFVRTHRPSLT